jgi:hypothetical protein
VPLDRFAAEADLVKDDPLRELDGSLFELVAAF